MKLHCHYLFPWDKNDFKIFEYFHEMYKMSQYIGGYADDEYINCTAKDQFVTRFQLMHYPLGGGHIQVHQHPGDAFKVTTISTLSVKGKDYQTGGVYFLNENGEKVHLDEHLDFGDVVVSYAGLVHGVDAVDPHKKLDWKTIDGRWTLLFGNVVSDQWLDGQKKSKDG